MNNVPLPGAYNPNPLNPSSAAEPASQPNAATANPATNIDAGAPVVKSKSESAAPFLDVPRFLQFVADKIRQAFSGQGAQPGAPVGGSSAPSYADGKTSGSRPQVRDFSAEIDDGKLIVRWIKNDEEMGALAEWLATSPPGLVKLDLEDWPLDEAGLTRLLTALKGNRLVTSLVIALDENSPAGMVGLVAALKENATLSSVQVTGATIDEDDAMRLASVLKHNTTLTALSLAGSRIGDAGVGQLATALKSNAVLTSLVLADEGIGADGVASLADMLKSNKTLETLVIMDAHIGDAGAACLAEGLKENTALTSLYLLNPHFGDAGVASIAEVLKFQKTLTSLELSHNAIGDPGAAMLAQMLTFNKTIRALSLANNQIADKGAREIATALMNNAVLKRLRLGGNQIGDAGAEALAKALQVNVTLENLGLAQYFKNFPAGLLPITSVGLAALAHMLRSNKSLTSLDLGFIERCSGADANALSEAVKMNETLTSFAVNFDVETKTDVEASKKAKEAIARIVQRNWECRLIAEGGAALQIASGEQYPADVMSLIAEQLAALPAAQKGAGLSTLQELGASIKSLPRAY